MTKTRTTNDAALTVAELVEVLTDLPAEEFRDAQLYVTCEPSGTARRVVRVDRRPRRDGTVAIRILVES